MKINFLSKICLHLETLQSDLVHGSNEPIHLMIQRFTILRRYLSSFLLYLTIRNFSSRSRRNDLNECLSIGPSTSRTSFLRMRLRGLQDGREVKHHLRKYPICAYFGFKISKVRLKVVFRRLKFPFFLVRRQ